MTGKAPVLVLIDDGYYGHEALHAELGAGFEVRFAAGTSAAQAAMSELVWPIVLAPRALEPEAGDVVLAELARRHRDFIGALILDQSADGAVERAGDGVHVIVRRPLKPGHLRLHAEAAARLRARLMEAQADAERLGADLARLRDGLRHDLRGHLQTIVGLASLLVELERPNRPPDDELVDFLTRILAGGERMNHFVDLLGDWLNAARRPLELASVDLGELLLEVVARAHTERNGVTTTLEPSDAASLGARISADARLLQNALEVLVARARSVGKPVRVSLAQAPEGWVVAVSDVLARAVPAPQRQKAFDLFEKVAGGDGIELAIVAKVAERHGAKVALEPLPDGGHAAVLTWPVG